MDDHSATCNPPPGSGWSSMVRAKEFWGLGLLVFIAYAPALGGEFIWDDLVLVRRNPLATGELTVFSIWFQGDFPLSTLVLWLQRLVWHDYAPGYHVVNVALHSLNGVLLWRVLVRVGVPGAWLGAALFVVHPVCAASVAWISELKNTLSLGFLLISVWGFLQSNEVSDRHSSRWYSVALVAFVLSLLTKTSGVMLPVVMLIYVCWPGRWPTLREGLRLGPFFLLALMFGLLTIWFQRHQVIGETALANDPWLARITDAGVALWFYLGKALAPVNLCMIYPRWALSGVVAFLPGLFWLALLALGWRFRRSQAGAVSFAALSYSVLLFPVLGFFDMYFLALARVSDHLQYLPLICITTLVGMMVARWLPPRVSLLVGATLILLLTVLTFQRAAVFATDERLWRDTLAKNPAAWTGHNNLGCILAERGDLAGAMRHFEDSLEENPDNAQARINLARGLAAQGSLSLAQAQFRMAQKLRPADPECYTHYAQALANAGRIPEAIDQLRAAANLKSTSDIHLQLASLYRGTGQIAKAIEQTRAALRVQPDNQEALVNLAWLLATTPAEPLRNGPEAVRLAGHACELTHFQDARALGALAAACAESGDFTNAVRRAEEAVRLAQAAGDARFATLNQQLLQVFRTGRPFRER